MAFDQVIKHGLSTLLAPVVVLPALQSQLSSSTSLCNSWSCGIVLIESCAISTNSLKLRKSDDYPVVHLCIGVSALTPDAIVDTVDDGIDDIFGAMG